MVNSNDDLAESIHFQNLSSKLDDEKYLTPLEFFDYISGKYIGLVPEGQKARAKTVISALREGITQNGSGVEATASAIFIVYAKTQGIKTTKESNNDATRKRLDIPEEEIPEYKEFYRNLLTYCRQAKRNQH
ncbi:hypothetical protein COU62_03105 [Candidatus Pacearchaeota archaeon CG10_big_fil_rev_8_21_14_0_10_35_219]|nr:hypothetical protein [Candidatus Pacearchaeota archaeon]OIO43489.1 MAG: hypothetical protein AUJ63_00100 [Candidatus Pacearchaeota archaeon CG1_02_35_32]PIO07611.1 MAG: hypothetical protein COU62_03105 [Candidatus Pacearchaeota archaeon CG10_big_fil_rev_8_21_14_0_10_35_219]PIY81845.1 MAG: hypothetical protein COY79_00580 [Candidatus Pacearchaeota archaeon CG_4_10_14_0_8_um_filter_35_169]PIZ80711.1 MAG: hypothetical protein COY00_00530 [Candidatus Pacearchaeota archaeon CG_4_10_14_0_2_um_filt